MQQIKKTKTFSETYLEISGVFPFRYMTNSVQKGTMNTQLIHQKEFCLIRVTEGYGKIHMMEPPQWEQELKKDDLVFLTPGCSWYLICMENSEFRCETVQFSGKVLLSDLRDCADIQCILPLNDPMNPEYIYFPKNNGMSARIMECTEDIFSGQLDNSAFSALLVRAALQKMIAMACAQRIIQGSTVAEGGITKLSEPIRTVKAYIEEHYAESLRIQDLAALCYFSETYLMNYFHAQTGMTVMEYVNQVRLREACKLLLNSGKSVADIAYSSGFRNLSNFNRCFRKVMGITPSAYRRGQNAQRKKPDL